MREFPETVISREANATSQPGRSILRWTEVARLSCLRSTPLLLALTLLAALAGCDNKPPASNGSQPVTASGPDASEIVKRYLATGNIRDSVLKMRARITDENAPSESRAPIELTIYRKRSADGAQIMLVEFNSLEERDRDALVTITPQGEAEGVRYVQSNDSFVTNKGVTSEESLFGMTMQELADGQPEKYDFWLTGEVPFLSSQAYRLQGKLKASAESKFPRLVLLISKEGFFVLSAEFYDSHDELARQITVNDAGLVAGHWTRLKWTLDNRARQKKIDFETTDAKYNQGLSDSIFTRQHLKEVATRK
jgi:hypothetical protein